MVIFHNSITLAMVVVVFVGVAVAVAMAVIAAVVNDSSNFVFH